MKNYKTLVGRALYIKRKDRRFKLYGLIICRENESSIFAHSKKEKYTYHFYKTKLFIEDVSVCNSYLILGPFLLENLI